MLSINEMISKSEKELPKIFSAVFKSSFPKYIDARGAPPIAASAANAEIIIIKGIATPTPVKARLPILSICPMYILSIRLYKTFTICAKIAGTESSNKSFFTGIVPNLSLSIIKNLHN